MTDHHPAKQVGSENELVQLARSNRDAFGKLIDHFYPQIFAYCMRRLMVRATAEDVTSEVFLKVAGGIRGFEGQSCEEFRRWIFRIATNEINAHLRQAIRQRELLEAAARLGAIDVSLTVPLLKDTTPVDWQDLYKVVAQLSDREQAIISLRFFGGLTHEQIADVLETRAGTIRVALNRALVRLRTRLAVRKTSQQSVTDSLQGEQKNV